MEQEIWKDIPWYEWLYQVSSLGNIKSLDRLKNGRILWHLSVVKWKTLSKLKDKDWYLKVWIKVNWIQKNFKLHRLVARTFIENPENKPQVNHKDWNKLNNCIDNLEWCTASENQKHSINVLWNKTMFSINHYNKWKFWKDNHTSKKINQYDLNWNFIKVWYWALEINRILNINNNGIRMCCRWKQKTAWWFIWKYE